MRNLFRFVLSVGLFAAFLGALGTPKMPGFEVDPEVASRVFGGGPVPPINHGNRDYDGTTVPVCNLAPLTNPINYTTCDMVGKSCGTTTQAQLGGQGLRCRPQTPNAHCGERQCGMDIATCGDFKSEQCG